jgi:predicted nuclease of predicted toxin-antitoxin system
MKILVDENIPLMTVAGLLAMGHDVKDLRGTSQQGIRDPEFWQIAVAEGRLIVTTDKGFTAYRAVQHHGILVVRLRQPNRQKIDRSVMEAMHRIPEADWPNLLVVVRDTTMSTSRSTTTS